MRAHPILGALLILSISFCSCHRATVAFDYTNAKDEVPRLGNLVFRFDKALVSDSLVNRWDSSEYISFEPRLRGHFRWDHPDELIFSPEEPLPPATAFKATLNDEILQYSSFTRIANNAPILFHTANLRLDNTNISWILQDEKSNLIQPQVDLYFNYAVSPDRLKEKLRFDIAGQSVNYSLMTVSADNKISLRLLDLKLEDKDYALSLSIEKGLVPEGGQNGTTETSSASLSIPTPYSLRINDLTTEHDGVTGTVFVATSQQVPETGLSSFISLNPAVPFTVQLEENGFSVQSDHFDVSKSYSITIRKGLRGRIGGVLKEEYNANMAFGKLEPSISFTSSKGVYLSATGEKNMAVRIINVPKIKVVISKIYENNLLAAQKEGYFPEDNNGTSGEGRLSASEPSVATVYGDVIFQKVIDTKNLPKYGNDRIFHFDMADLVPEFKGIYHVMIRSTEDYWVRDGRFVSMSDIGMIAKEGTDKILVFTNSIQNTHPLEGTQVIAYGANNQALGVATTNSEGVAEIAYSRKEIPGFRPAMIIAKSGADFNYLPFNGSQVNTSRFETGGRRYNPIGLDAFVYPERDIYRPGEKINFSVILRTRDWASPGEIPLKLKFLLPTGKELKEFRKNLNQEGSMEGNIDLDPAAITGTYSLEVYTSNDVLLATEPLRVEEFVPDRIKVTANLSKAFLVPGDSSSLHIHAINFFGPPASGRNYECEVQVKQRVIHPHQYPNFDFGLANQNSFFDKIQRQGKTDDQGNAVEIFETKPLYRNMGVLRTDFFTTVFDETGRPVSRITTADIFTQPVFFGVFNDGEFYCPLNSPVRFPIIAVDRSEKLLSGINAKVEVVKHEYRTVLTKNGDFFRYESQKEDQEVVGREITISGENSHFDFVPASPGEYELRVSIPGANAYVSREFYSYGFWGGENSSFEVNNEGHIDIRTDKASYYSGESVKALFKTPFSGRMLITTETDKTLTYQFVDVEKKSASVDLALSDQDIPNVYISATLFKAHAVSDIPLTVAHGYENVKVEGKGRKMAVSIDAIASTRSRTHQKVRVKAEPNSMVTLAAVDNGILQVTDFSTPDPYLHFYSKKALGVTSYDLYPLLFPEIKTSISSSGGDNQNDMSKRINPMPSKRFKLMSYWSGLKQANNAGEADFDFEIPQFSGQVRLMAVAYKGSRFGSADAITTVADPIVLSTAAPRFLSPGDSVDLGVTLTNTTSRQAPVTVTVKLEGALESAGNQEREIRLGPKQENHLRFQVVAPSRVGSAKIIVQAVSSGEKFVDETEIAIRPASPLQKRSGSGSIEGGSSLRINLQQADFIPASVGAQLVISRSPALGMSKYLDFLLEYPYGCTEQTVSQAFPQLYYGELADFLRAGKSGLATANYNVLEAIRKIRMRQLYSGGVTLWDNEGTEDWWATIYSAHFLIEARKAGFEVDQAMLDPMLSYISNRMRNRETIIYYYNRDENRRIAPKEVCYGLYVLSLAGEPDISVMNYYKANPELLSLDCKYLLSAAYAIAGDRISFRQFLPDRFAGEESVAQSGGSYYSDIRDESIALNVLVDADPENTQIPLMAKHLGEKLSERSWYSTQEIAFSFLALGKMAKTATASHAEAEVRVNGKTIAKTGGEDLRLTGKQLNGNEVELVATGSGRLFYYYVVEGISVTGAFKEEDSYIRIRRQFFDRTGRPVFGESFKQNDLIIVQLTLEKSYDGKIDNIVITDPLPAGFEIENPRTKEIPGMDWIKDQSPVTAMDVRDDRINLFVNAISPKQTYYYAARAVTPGTYRMGPVGADAMYKGECHSYHGARTIHVNP